MKKLFASFITLLSTISLSAQHPVVIFHQNALGMVKVKKGREWVPVSNGAILQDTCWLQLKKNSKVVIIRKDDSFFQLSNTNDPVLTKKIDLLRPFEKQSGATGRLFNAAEKIFSNPMKVVPAGKKGEKYDMLFPADNELILDKSLIFTWQNNTKSPSNFYLKDPASSPGSYLCVKNSLDSKTVKLAETKSCINLSRLTLSKYSWSIIATKDSNERKYFIDFFLASEAQKLELKSAVRFMDEFSVKVDKGTYYLLLCGIYEDSRFYFEAYKTYNKAMRELPESLAIEKSCQAFIQRIQVMNQPSIE